MTQRRLLLTALLFCVWLPGLERAAHSEDAPFRIGMSAAFSGPARELGEGMRKGIESYFAHVNKAGGVLGKKLALIALDDAYEPARTGPNMRRLIDDEQVFAVLGNPGTPTATVAVPIANEKRVPFFGAFSGAGLLRKTPPDRYVVNLRASYAQETAEMIDGLVNELGLRPDQLAFFTQNDAYGDSGYNGAIAALKRLGYQDAERLPHARYPRNTLDVEAGLSRLLDPSINPRAIIMIGASKPCAKLIRLAKQHGLQTLFVNVSFVLGDALNRELGPDGENVVVTQVVPAYDSDLPVVREYRAAIAAEDISFISLEGFIAAKAMVEGLKRSGPNPTRELFIDTLERGPALDLGLGETHPLSKTRHQISDRVWPTVIKHGRFEQLDNWSQLKPYLRVSS
jgi:ABC-type branched-subunit amino acid transport system substrate-binding protein